MNKFIIISVLAISALLFGCASIVHGPLQTVDFISQPKGAKLTIDGKDFGITPRSVDLPRVGKFKGDRTQKMAYNVKIELEGYYPYEFRIKRELDGWFVGNIVLGGLVGIVVDAATGSMYKLNPDQIIATLGRRTDFDEEVESVIVNPDIDDEASKIIYPSGKLILFRRAKREIEQPFDFSINNNITGSFLPFSYMEVDVEVTEEPIIIFYSNGFDSTFKIELGAGETKYIECSLSKNDNVPKIMEVEPKNGKFYADQAKFYQDKREKDSGR